MKNFEINTLTANASANYSEIKAYADGAEVKNMYRVPTDVAEFKFNAVTAVYDLTIANADWTSIITPSVSYENGVVSATLSENLLPDTVYDASIEGQVIFTFKTATAEGEIKEGELCKTDLSGSNLTAGSKVHGNATFVNNTGKQVDFGMVLGLYKDKMLEAVIQTNEVLSATDVERDAELELTLPEGFSATEYELKLFVFDSMDNLKPVGNI